MRTFLCGASDPEMRRSKEILLSRGETWIQAKKDGNPVHPGNAHTGNNRDEIPEGAEVFSIECSVEGITPRKAFDHHNPGDAGYALGSEQFWEASSLGQLCQFLGITEAEVPQEDRVLAAMDHCYGAAMQGRCPGVTAQEVWNMDAIETAQSTGVGVKRVREEIEKYREIILTRTDNPIRIGDTEVIIIPDPVGMVYSLNYLAAKAAAALCAVPILVGLKNDKDSPKKIHLFGDVKPETISEFMSTWAPERGLTGIYGCPDRGYAGGFLQK